MNVVRSLHEELPWQFTDVPYKAGTYIQRTYQPYMEFQLTTLVIVCMMNTHPEAFVSYHSIFKRKRL